MFFTRYIAPFACQDGYKRRLLLKKWSAALENPYPAPVEVRGGADPVRFVWGTPGGDDLYPALPGSSATITLADRVLIDAVSVGPLGWQAVLEIELTPGSGIYAPEWTGYVRQDRISYEPYGMSGVQMQADDAVRVWKDLAFGYSDQPIASYLRQWLEVLGAQSGLYTLMPLAPELPVPMPADEDPLFNLYFQRELFESGQHAARMQAAALAVLQRFMLRLFQSQGAWYALARYALPRPSTGGSSTADLWLYEDAAQAAVSVDLSYDAAGLAVAVGERAETRMPARLYTCTYEFEPSLDEIIQNGEFEEAKAGAYAADRWEFRAHVADVGGSGRRVPSPEVTSEDAYELHIGYRNVGEADDPAATQADEVFVPANADQEFVLTGSFRTAGPDLVIAELMPPRMAVEFGDFALYSGTITTTGVAVPGRRTTIRILPLGDPAANTTFVEGTPVIPPGAVIYFGDTPVTLLEPAAIGDTRLTAESGAEIPDASTGRYAYFSLGSDNKESLYAWTSSALRTTFDLVAYMLTPEGEAVTGTASVRFYSPAVATSPPGPYTFAHNDPDTYYVAIEQVAARIQVGGDTVSNITWQASAPSIQYGAEGDLGEMQMGDGPTTASDTRIFATADAGATFQETFQGQATNWTEGGVHEPDLDDDGNPIYRNRTLDQLCARIALKEEAGGLERLITTFITRPASGVPTRPYAPHQVLQNYQTQPLALPSSNDPVSGNGVLSVGRRIRPGALVTIGAEMLAVAEIAGGDPFIIHLDGPLSRVYRAGERVSYTVDYWWDRLEWNVRRGEVFFDGTELFRADVPVVEQVITEAG